MWSKLSLETILRLSVLSYCVLSVDSIALVEKHVYIGHIKKILDDATKFEKVKIKKRVLNFSINHERCIKYYLKSLEKSGSLTTDQHKKTKAIESRPGILCGFCKYIKLSLMLVRHLDLYFWQ